jgi:DNA polymerase III alpha subunit
VTREVWRQIESFAGYSFSKAHSASYAVESYQSLYLKAHFLLEFITGVINNFGGFYSSWVYFNEAKVSGANLHPPCVNQSEYKTCIKGSDLYLGFIHVANLESEIAKAIAPARKMKPFSGLEDFVGRVPVALEQLILLIRAGAFRFTGKPKAALLWEAHMAQGAGHRAQGTGHRGGAELFQIETKKFGLPPLEHDLLADVYDEIELLGFPVTHTWFDLLKIKFRGDILAHEMADHVGKRLRMLGLLVTIKYVRTVKKEWMHFGTFIDVNGRFFDTVHFPPAVAKYPFCGDGIYLVKGKIVSEFGFPSLEVEKMAKMPLKPDPRG